jgi:hypothetical protein
VLFNSPIFLFIFLPATVAAYIVLRDWAGPRAVLGLLVAASVVFYGCSASSCRSTSTRPIAASTSSITGGAGT